MGNSEYTRLGSYIVKLCEAQNLSLRQASLRAGLEAGTLSKILRRDGQSVPNPDTLGKIARGLNGDYLHMMSLAGHLPESGHDEELSAEIQAKLKRLDTLVREVARRDPARAAELLALVITPFEVMKSMDGPDKQPEVALQNE